MSKKVADQLIECLVRNNIKRVYAVTGDSLNEINNAVRINKEIEWVHVRHEEVGAYAAGAEAQLTGEIACCAGSSGPGHVHLINGLYDAHRSNAPVIAIASAIPSSEQGVKYFQETDTMKLFDDCSYYNELATTPQQFPRMLHSALQASICKKGVSVIGVPGDLTKMEAVSSRAPIEVYKPNSSICPQKNELEKLAQLLNNHSNITLFCGMGCKGAHDEVVYLSKLLNAPVAYTFKSKMELQYENPNEVGLTGLLGMPSGYYSMHEADVLLMLGTDFPYSVFLPENVKTIQIDIKPDRLGRRTNLEMGLCGDIKSTLTALFPLLKAKDNDDFLQKQLKRYKSVKDMLSSYVESKGQPNLIHPEYVMSVVNKLASKSAIFTVDTGMCCVWGARYLEATKERSMLGSFNHGSMANALPQSIGAAFAFPDKQIVALCGDGGLSMLLGDLQTIAQYKLPIKIVVFNNRALGMVKLEMEVDGLPDSQTDMVNPDFAKVAEAMDIANFTVTDPEKVESTLQTLFNTDGPALISIFTDPNALAMPPVVKWDEMKGFTQSMLKMIMNGRTDEVVAIVESNFKHMKEVL